MGASLNVKFLVLAVGMVITGSINTLSTKLADITYSKGVDGHVTQFDHPFVQAVGMFIGEFMCLIAFRILICSNGSEKVDKAKPFNPIIFLLPALCDMTATSMMYIGLTWTYASVFQMLRGAVVIFTGILSVLFLKRKLYLYHWFGMVLVLAGLSLVGLASLITGDENKNAPKPLLGDIIIIIAQFVVSIQMVVEEKFLSKYEVPALQAVGWEGFFGFVVLGSLLVPFYFIPNFLSPCSQPHSIPAHCKHLENAIDAYYQIRNSWVVAVGVFGTIISIAFFNYFGISVTKTASATTRMVLDSIRTVVIWMVSICVSWQAISLEENLLQVGGFVLLLLGTCIYNEVGHEYLPSFLRKPKEEYLEEQGPLLEDSMRYTGNVQEYPPDI